MAACDLCYSPTPTRRRDDGSLLCKRCRDYAALQASMTPEERAAEDQMIADYVAQAGDL